MSTPSPMRRFLNAVLFQRGWDMRVRNRDVVAALRPFLTPGAPLLDVGCGDRGLAAFLSRVEVVGVDLEPVTSALPNLTLHRGSITALPFADKAFPLVSCIDTLEHLPPEVRIQAIDELVRVARQVLVIACPLGDRARRHDENFRTALQSRGKDLPPWLREHLQHAYPELTLLTEALQRAADRHGKRFTLCVSYSEPLGASRLVRLAAVRSRWLYGVVNALVGSLYPLLPRPAVENAYRVVMTVRFAERERRGDGPEQSVRGGVGLAPTET